MRRALVVAKWEFLSTIRKKEYLLSTVLTPAFGAVMALLPFLLFNQGVSTLSVGYVDHTGMFELPPSLTGSVPENVSYRVLRYSSEEVAKRELLQGRVSMYMVIPENYLDTGRVEVYVTRATPTLLPREEIAEEMVRQMLRGRLEDKLVERVSRPLEPVVYRLNDRGERAEEMGLVAYMYPLLMGALLMMALLISSGFLMHSMNEERENRLWEVLLSSVSAEELIAGKMLGLGGAGLLQLGAWMVLLVPLAVVVSLTLRPGVLLLGVAYFILGFLMYASIMAGAGALCTSSKEAQQATSVLVMFVLLPVAFGFMIFQNPDSQLARAVSLFPLSSPAGMVYRISVARVPVVEIVLSMLALLLTSLAMLYLSGRLLRARVLMQGGSLGDVLREALRRR